MIALLILAAAQAAAQPVPQVMHRAPPPPKISGADSCLPLKFIDNMPVIEAAIGARKVSLGFDTGAPGGPLLQPAIIGELNLPQVGEARMTDPSMRNVLSVPIHALRGLKVGNLTVEEWNATARPHRESRRFADPDGIIGLTAFAGYVVTIDYPSGRMLISKGRLPEPDGKSSFKFDGPIPRVPLTIDGKTIDAHLDTGNARYSLILPESFASGLPGHANRFPIGIARTINNSFNLMAQPVREAKVGELPLYAGTAAYPGPSPVRGNIGSPLLKDMIVKVDPANGIVALERAKPGLENGCPAA
ncbi:MAG TPA: hypothetical protein VFZ35_00885 [Sphingomicrobium sp.]